MAERSILTRLRADVSGFVNGMRTAQKATNDFVSGGLSKIDKHSAAIDNLSNRAGVAGVALTGLATAAVAAFANFDQAMSNVQAATMESADNMNRLRDAALEAGQRTQYSATEAAAAIEELAKAGVSTTDILAGGLDGALDLAASGGIAVADAAETAASAMTQFGLSGQDVTHIADLLAAGAGKAQGGVSEMGAALNQAGLVASQMGLSIEETVGSLTAFASAGLIGSDAGTAFRSALLRLANPTKESAGLMAELGLQFYDAQGDFIGMEGVAGQLQDRLAGLTQEQRNAALAQIFGQDAIRAASILYEQGAAGVQEWTAAVNDQGFAAEQAAIRMDNLRGDIEELGGALETALINMGEGGDGALRGIVQSVTNVVNAFSDLPPVAQQATLAITGGGGLALLGVAGMGKLVTSISEARTALQNLGVSARTAGAALGVVGGVFTAATLGVTLYANAQAEADAMAQSLSDTLDAQTGALTDNSTAWVQNELTKDQSFGIRNTKSMAEAAEEMGISLDLLTQAYLGNSAAAEEAKALADEYAASNFDLGLASQSLANTFNRNIDDQQSRLADARDIQQSKLEVDEAAAGAQEDLAGATQSVTAALDAQVASLEEVIGLQRDLAGVVLSERDAQRGFQESILAANESLEEHGQNLDITTEAGRANQEALDGLAASGWDLLESMEANGASQETLQGTMAVVRENFLQAATAMGMGSEEALALADSLGLIPENVTTEVEADTTGAEEALAAAIAAIEAGEGTVDINGNPIPVEDVLMSVRQSIADTEGQVTIDGDDHLAIEALDSVLTAIRNGNEEVTIGGKKYPAEQATSELLAWIAQRNANVNIGVNDAAVRDWTPPTWYTYLDVRVRTSGAANVPGTMVQARAAGGYISGPGGPTDDLIPAYLSNGEYVVRARAVQRYGLGMLDALNAERLASGGLVGAVQRFAEGGSARAGYGISIAANFDVDFQDLNAAYDSVIEKNRELAEAAAAATESTEDSWEDFIGRFPTTTAGLIGSFEDQIRAHQEWERNMLGLAGRVGPEFIDMLGEMGTAGADLVGQLAASSDAELATLDQHVRTWARVQEAQEEAARAAEEAAERVENARRSVADFTRDLEVSVRFEELFAESTRLISGRVSDEFLDALADMGEQGLELAENLSYATDQELAYIDTLYREKAAQEALVEARERAADAMGTWIGGVARQSAALGDFEGAYQEALSRAESEMRARIDRINAEIDAENDRRRREAERYADSTLNANDNADDYYSPLARREYEAVRVSADQVLAVLEEQKEAMLDWREDLLDLSSRTSTDFFRHVATELGPEWVDLLATATQDELIEFNELWKETGEESGEAFAETLMGAAPVMREVGWRFGDEFRDSVAEKLAAAQSTLQGVINSWDLNARVRVTVDNPTGSPGQRGFASGGYTGETGGIVHAREFVTNPTATARWRPVLEDMNAGRVPRLVPAAVGGGPVTLSEESVRAVAQVVLAGAGAVGAAQARKAELIRRQGGR